MLVAQFCLVVFVMVKGKSGAVERAVSPIHQVVGLKQPL